MQSILHFIQELEAKRQENIKVHAQLMAEMMWEFGIKLAEKFFLYNENAEEYAEKILFLQLNQPFDKIIEIIHQDFKLYDIPYNEDEVYSILLSSYNKTIELKNNNKNKCFYI